MKSFIAGLLAIASVSSFAQDKPIQHSYKLAPQETKIGYVAGKITGADHTGHVTAKSGNIVFQGEEIVGGEVIVDMNSLTSTDITDSEMNAKYVGHIKSPDFFDTAKHPEAKIVIKNSKKTKNGLEVTGDLTFIGKTNPVTFLVTDVKQTPSSVSAKSKLNIDRTKWGLKYGSGSFFKGLGDKTINDEFSLSIELVAKK